MQYQGPWKKHWMAAAFATLLPVAMAGCGSDGGGSVPGGTLYSGSTTKASVDGTNYDTVAGTSMFGSLDSLDLAMALPSKPGGGGDSNVTIVDLARHHLETAAREAAASGSQKVLQAVQPPQDCLDSLNNPDGTYTVDLYGFSITATGGSFSGKVTYSACNVGDDTYVDGAVTMSLAFNSSGNTDTLNLLVVFDSLHHSEPLGSIDVTLDGGVAMNGTDNTATGDSTGSVTVNFDIIDAVSGTEVRFENVVFSIAGTSTDESASINGRVYIKDPVAGVDGYVDIITVSPVVTLAADTYPSSGGPLIIQAANGVTVQITPLDNVNAEVSVDANGDGDFLDLDDVDAAVVAWASM